MEDLSDVPSVDDIICRNEQIHLLKGLIRETPCALPSCLFVYGFPGTGKSLVFSSFLRERKIYACYANCIEFYSPKIVYESLLNQLKGYSPNEANNYSPFSSSVTLAEFVSHLKKHMYKHERYALIFEHSERLRDCDINIFPALCRLQEFVENVNLCVVFFSRIPLEKFRVSGGILEPIVIRFPQYTKDELGQILVASRPVCRLGDESYKNYINMLLSVFYLATRNLPELKHLAELNLKSYCDPILNGECSEDNIRYLWKNIEPKFRKALSTVYLREVSSEQFIRMQNLMEDDNSKEIASQNQSFITKMELPFYSKFLLVAAYLASYNPASSDKRFFTKNHGKKRKTQAMIKAKQSTSSQLAGPKPFPLNRMLAIFYSIIEDKVAPTAHIFTQISSLVSLRLLTTVGSDDPLAAPKYKSNVSLDFILSVARTVSFDILQYLYDYNS